MEDGETCDVFTFTRVPFSHKLCYIYTNLRPPYSGNSRSWNSFFTFPPFPLPFPAFPFPFYLFAFLPLPFPFALSPFRPFALSPFHPFTLSLFPFSFALTLPIPFPSPLPLAPPLGVKQRNRIREPIDIIRRVRQTPPVPIDHAHRPDGIQIVHPHALRPPPLEGEDARLARLPGAKVGATRRVIVEERVQAGAIGQDVLRVQDAQAPRVGAVARDARAGGDEIGVLQRFHGGEGDGGVGVGLVVRRLRLDLAHEDVLRSGQLILIQRVMFHRCPPQPDRALLALDQQSPAGVNGDLDVVRGIDVVVRGPEPHVLEVEVGGRGGDVHGHESGDAVRVDGRGGRSDRGGGGAVGELELGAGEAADAGVHVPDGGGDAAAGGKVVLDEDGAGLGALGADDHVAPFDGCTVFAVLPDLDDGLGFLHVVEKGTA